VVIEVIAPDRDRATRALERLPGVGDVQLFGERAHVRLEASAPLSDPVQLASALAREGIAVESARRVPASLEDVFIARVAKETA
jgi:hypothetical protein